MEPMDKVKNVISVGDEIAYATKSDDGARLKTGTVKKITETNGYEWKYDSTLRKYTEQPVRKFSLRVKIDDFISVTLTHLDRVVVLNPKQDEILREHLSEYGKYILDQRYSN